MQTKLTLAQLSGYLAYGLQVKIIPLSDLYEEKITTIECLSDEFVTFNKAPDYYFNDHEPDIDFKPLVIPLDRLTEAQWVEVFKSGCEEFSEHFTVDVDDNWVTLDRCYDISTFDFRWKEFKISYHLPPFNQLAAFAKLHELHADLHGWIEKGLAINKLDYEK